MRQVLEAFYRSKRPVDIIGEGWHLLLWNTGAGVVTLGMWKDGEQPQVVDWHRIATHIDGWQFEGRTSTVKMVADVERSIRNDGYRLESWLVSGFSEPRKPNLP